MALASGGAGCETAWRPPLAGVQVASASITADLSGRMPPPGARLTYRRTSLLNPKAAPEQYVVQVTCTGWGEGKLTQQSRGPLASHVEREGAQGPAQQFPWPHPWGASAVGFFLEFDPPLVSWPRVVEGGSARKCESRFKCYGARGQYSYRGSATRAIELEGYETVSIDGVNYNDCVRLCTETRFCIPWIAYVDLTEYSWLAPGIGEVKRLQCWTGLALLVYFKDIVQYELVSVEHPAEQPAERSAERRAPVRWSRCAVYLDPALPTPQLQGLAVEKAPPPAETRPP